MSLLFLQRVPGSTNLRDWQVVDQLPEMAGKVVGFDADGKPAILEPADIVAAGAVPTTEGVPTLSAQHTEDETITATPPTFEKSSSLEWQWQSSEDDGETWDDLDGETAATYVIDGGQVGNVVRAGVRAANVFATGDWVYSDASVTLLAAE